MTLAFLASFCCCRPLLTAKLFMRLITDDPYGRVMILHIFNFVMKKTWLKQTRIGLMSYDFAGKGFLTEEVGWLDLERVLVYSS
jgi:hypothetical protein